MTESPEQQTIFPAWLGLRALESTSYKTSAYALSEVVDNSFGANAKNIHVAVIWSEDNKKPDAIAVLDDGKGMDAYDLRRAIQYGNGENVDKDLNDIKGLGRFGVGLLAATFNQCHSLSVWSWQNGIDSDNTTLNVNLDVNAIKESQNNFLPIPEKSPLPVNFHKMFNNFKGIHENPLHGTLVVWRKFHKFSWKTSDTLLTHLAFECGRIYRNLIGQKNLKIVLSVCSPDGKELNSQLVTPVDPMFLKKWEHKDLEVFEGSMFQPYDRGVQGDNRRNEAGDIFQEEVSVYDDDEKIIGKYWIEASHRKIPTVVQQGKLMGHTDPGNAPFGKLAKRLLGVSVLREGRELTLDTKWLPADKTLARWLAVSINFEAKLDHVFGVDNSKQAAHHLSALAGVPDDSLESVGENSKVIEAARKISELVRKMHIILRDERKNERTRSKETSTVSPISVSDGRLRQFGDDGAYWSEKYPAESDKINPADNPSAVAAAYVGTFFDDENGQDIPAEKIRPPHIIAEKIKVDFVREPAKRSAFFDIRERQGVQIIVLNQNHPLYERLKDICLPLDMPDEEDDNDNPLSCEEKLQNVQDRLDNAMWVIQQLLYCYARAECEASDTERDEFEMVRSKWGRVVKRFMKEH